MWAEGGVIPQVCLPGAAKETVIYFPRACHENVSTEIQIILEGKNVVGEMEMEELQQFGVRARARGPPSELG